LPAFCHYFFLWAQNLFAAFKLTSLPKYKN
jgi:hypothetical protein